MAKRHQPDYLTMRLTKQCLTASLVLFSLFGLAGPGHATDLPPAADALLGMLSKNWATETSYTDYFAPDKLETIYSARFAEIYRQAQKHPAIEGSDDPFDYDPLTGTQDGCPPTEFEKTETEGPDGSRDVTVSFDLFACHETVYPLKRRTLTIRLVPEGGKLVISDLIRVTSEGNTSVLTELERIAKGP